MRKPGADATNAFVNDIAKRWTTIPGLRIGLHTETGVDAVAKHEKRYKVFHAMTGSFPMYVGEYEDLDVAREVAAGQPDGSGFAVEVYRDVDPGVAGGIDRAARQEEQQEEGRQTQRARREAASVTPLPRDTETPPEVKKAAAEEVERTNKVVEKAAARGDAKAGEKK
jgi:hypothetical protein